jgi:hypothetical protein
MHHTSQIIKLVPYQEVCGNCIRLFIYKWLNWKDFAISEMYDFHYINNLLILPEISDSILTAE